MTHRFTTESEAHTMALAAHLARGLRPGDVLALDGPLGAGKTCFVRGLARGLGLDPRQVSSPTFIICQEYERTDATPLAHIDAYRLGDVEELDTIGWDEMLGDRRMIIAVEWSGKIESALPADRVRVEFEHVGPVSRELTIDVARPELDELLESYTPPSTEPSPCPICARAVMPDAETYPFCTSRCRMVDLGKWMSGEYRVSRPIEADDELE